jgi:hypothetical protein
MAQVLAHVTVKDSATGIGVPGAVLSVQGKSYRTDSTGLAEVWIHPVPGIFTEGNGLVIEAKAQGYVTYKKASVIGVGSGPIPVSILMESNGTRASVLVRVAGTGAPIAGAKVFVDANIPSETGSDGKAVLSFKNGLNVIKASKPGYTEATLSYTVTSNLIPAAPVFDLVPLQVERKNIRIVVAPHESEVQGQFAPTAGANVILTVAGLQNEYQALDGQGGVMTGYQHTPGTLIAVTVSKEGWTTLVDNVTVESGIGTYVIGPMEKTDPQPGITEGKGPEDIQLTPTSSSISLPTASLHTPDDYEYIYPSGEFGRYFTTAQARMYVGNLFVDELHTIQFALQGNRIPIYGYASRDFDAVGQGKALVQGQIYINFVSEGYLYTILKEFKKLRKTIEDSGNEEKRLQQEFEDLRRYREQILSQSVTDQFQGDVTFFYQPEVPEADLSSSQRLAMIEARMAELASSGPHIIDGAKRIQLADIVAPDGYVNALYLPVSFDVEIELEGAGRVVKRRLERCYLGANEQVMDQSGNVIGETYSFIARRCR